MRGSGRLTRVSLLVGAISMPVVLTGCKTTDTAFDNNCKAGGAAIGAVIGGVAGGLLLGKGGGKVGTALLGAAVGGLIGQQVGSLLDCQDRQALATASQAAGDAPVGERVVWASDTAQVPPSTPSVPVATPSAMPSSEPKLAAAKAPSQPKAKPQPRPQTASVPSTTREAAAPQQQGGAWSAVEPSASGSGKWAAVEPIRSGGQSGNWGWVEPISAPSATSDGRTCRALKQVVVDPSGKQHEEDVTSCLNEQKQWVVASR